MDAMIDLETFATAPNAGVVQLGVAFFDPLGDGLAVSASGLTLGWEWNVSLQSCLLLGGVVEYDTIAWWQGRPRENQRALLGEPAVSIGDCLSHLSALYETHSPQQTWSHGAAFDVPILDFYCRALSLRTPWRYSSVRDTRTLFWLAKDAGWEAPRRDTAHTALADAEAQAADVQQALRELHAHQPRDRGDVPAPATRREGVPDG